MQRLGWIKLGIIKFYVKIVGGEGIGPRKRAIESKTKSTPNSTIEKNEDKLLKCNSYVVNLKGNKLEKDCQTFENGVDNAVVTQCEKCDWFDKNWLQIQ